jgi:hypothetical protein
VTEEEPPTETKVTEDLKRISGAMSTLALIFVVVGGTGILFGSIVSYGLAKIGISMTPFDYALTLMMSIFLLIIGFILWSYAPQE